VTVGADIGWGIRRGLAFAALFCLWATVIYMVSGPEAFARKHTSYGAVVTAYLAIGILVGAIIGAGRTHATTEGRCLLLGLAAGLPIAVGITIAVSGMPQAWPPGARLFVPVYSIAAGWFIGNELDKARRAHASLQQKDSTAS
jgi:hypothetical protein